MKIVYVDFDGTLVRSNSMHYLYFNLWHRWLKTKSLRSLAQYISCILAFPLVAMAHFVDHRLRDRLTYFFYRGLTQKDLEDASSEFFQQRQPGIPQTVEFLKSKKQEGYSIVIVSGSIPEIILEATQQLDVSHLVDHLLTSRLAYAGLIANGRMENQPMIQEEKVKAIQTFEQGLSVQERICMSDSWSDRPMLELGQHAVVINPDSKLIAHARRKNWEIWLV